MISRSKSSFQKNLGCITVLLLLAPPTQALSLSDTPRDPLKPFVGEWVVDNANPSGTNLVLRQEGTRLIGSSPSGEESLEFKSTGEFGFLEGTLIEEDGKVSATIELSRRENRIIIELAPPQSEYVIMTARKVQGSPSVEASDAIEKANVRVENAKQNLTKALASKDDGALQNATNELQDARLALAKLTESDTKQKVASKQPATDKQEKPSFEIRTEEAAIKQVSSMPDIREWVKDVEAANKKGDQPRSARFEATEEGKRFVVHVFEYVGTDEEGHTATLGWYNVDKATGGVTEEKMF
ncbi:hypothetical protein CVU37_03390 [candidate division BRC1 bacterium HGW-BRC1-1]|jgi:adenylate kinase family enzyme|nr:MAG: hypothetical protein CVU37_03390 [candidate division BRC1 bacterium HGW-BRC1-1]